MRNAYKILIGKLKGRDLFRVLGIDRIVILKWII
jgi:hypothetical protein